MHEGLWIPPLLLHACDTPIHRRTCMRNMHEPGGAWKSPRNFFLRADTLMHARVCMHACGGRERQKKARLTGDGEAGFRVARVLLGDALCGCGDENRRARGGLDHGHRCALAPRASHVFGECAGNRALRDDEHKCLVRHGDDSTARPLCPRGARAHVALKCESGSARESGARLQHAPLGGRVAVGGRAVAVVAVVHCVAFRESVARCNVTKTTLQHTVTARKKPRKDAEKSNNSHAAKRQNQPSGALVRVIFFISRFWNPIRDIVLAWTSLRNLCAKLSGSYFSCTVLGRGTAARRLPCGLRSRSWTR